MQALSVCRRLFALSQNPRRVGTVHSVFDHAVNFEFREESLIGLLAQEKALTPYAVSVRTSTPFLQAGVRADMEAYLKQGVLTIPEAEISLNLACAAVVDLCIDSIQMRNLDFARAELERLILTSLNGVDEENSLAPVVTGKTGNIYTRFLSSRLERFFAAIAEETFEEAAPFAANCAGCGMGLTPSSDDLLCGYFLTLHLLFRASGNDRAKDSISTMAQAAAKRTNRISGSFLLQSGSGLANAAICELFRSTFSEFDTNTAERAIRRILGIGSTSGADMLTGIVLALRQHIGGNAT